MPIANGLIFGAILGIFWDDWAEVFGSIAKKGVRQANFSPAPLPDAMDVLVILP